MVVRKLDPNRLFALLAPNLTPGFPAGGLTAMPSPPSPSQVFAALIDQLRRYRRQQLIRLLFHHQRPSDPGSLIGKGHGC
jgi:hypothetical protein